MRASKTFFQIILCILIGKSIPGSRLETSNSSPCPPNSTPLQGGDACTHVGSQNVDFLGLFECVFLSGMPDQPRPTQASWALKEIARGCSGKRKTSGHFPRAPRTPRKRLVAPLKVQNVNQKLETKHAQGRGRGGAAKGSAFLLRYCCFAFLFFSILPQASPERSR